MLLSAENELISSAYRVENKTVVTKTGSCWIRLSSGYPVPEKNLLSAKMATPLSVKKSR